MLKCLVLTYFIVSWRWIFWINLPIVGLGYIMVTLFLKLHHTKSAPFIEQLKRVDWFGSFLFIASATSILIPVSWVRWIFSPLAIFTLTCTSGRSDETME